MYGSFHGLSQPCFLFRRLHWRSRIHAGQTKNKCFRRICAGSTVSAGRSPLAGQQGSFSKAGGNIPKGGFLFLQLILFHLFNGITVLAGTERGNVKNTESETVNTLINKRFLFIFEQFFKITKQGRVMLFLRKMVR